MNQEWTDKQMAEINAEMADGILIEIGDTLNGMPCSCDIHNREDEGTAPMFYREKILCVIGALRRKIVDLGGEDPFKVAPSQS